MVALWCLQITFLERFAVPCAVSLVNIHMVHMYRHPHVGSGIGYLVVDMVVYQEIVGLCVTIFNIIDARLRDT